MSTYRVDFRTRSAFLVLERIPNARSAKVEADGVEVVFEADDDQAQRIVDQAVAAVPGTRFGGFISR